MEIAESSTTPAACSTTTAPTPTPSWASAGPATWASTSCTSTCTRPSPRPTAAAGPGRGPSRCASDLVPFLPAPMVENGRRPLLPRLRPARVDRPHQGVLRQLRHAGARPTPTSACTAPTGCGSVSERAVLNANYLMRRLAEHLRPALRSPLHARVRAVRAAARSSSGVRTLDIAKRLLDYGCPRADDLLPAHRRRGHHDRADRDRDARRRWTSLSTSCCRSRGRSKKTRTSYATRPTIRPCAGWTRRGRPGEPNLCWCPPVFDEGAGARRSRVAPFREQPGERAVLPVRRGHFKAKRPATPNQGGCRAWTK